MCSAREPVKSLKNNWLPYPRLVRSGRPTAERHVTDGSLLVTLSSHRQSPSVSSKRNRMGIFHRQRPPQRATLPQQLEPDPIALHLRSTV